MNPNPASPLSKSHSQTLAPSSSNQLPPQGHTAQSLTTLATHLFTLSKQALAVSEFETHYDLDFIATTILHGLFLLYDGKARVAHTIYPTMGKLINLARGMGLHLDPDEFGASSASASGSGEYGGGFSVGGGGTSSNSAGKYSLFDAEARRRAWWDIYYYDLFLSDSMGQEPLINDEWCTTRLPADVDEEAFRPESMTLPPPRPESNSSYFIMKCRLAQLLKTMRHRWVAEQFTMEMWLEAAQEFENEVNTWLSNLPPEFRMPAQGSESPPTSGDVAAQYLAAQRCELAAFAKSLILKAYTPLLKKNPNKPSSAVHLRAAQLACSDAAHVIIDACYGLFQTFGASRPSSYVFYSFGRQIFAAAAISASIVIQNPASLVAKPAMHDLQRALELMRDPVISGARGNAQGLAAGSTTGGGESLHIVELLYAKALEALGGRAGSGNGSGTYAGMKRKHSDVDITIPVGFTLPFVGGSLTTGPPLSPSPPPSATASGTAAPPKSRLRSGTVNSKRGAATAGSESAAASPARPTRLSPGSMDPPPDPASTAVSSPIGAQPTSTPPAPASSGKAVTAKERRKASAYPSIGVRKRPSKSANGGGSSTASRSHAGEDSSDAASSTYASSVRGPPSIIGGDTGEGDGINGAKSEAGSSRALSIKRRAGLPSASTSSFSDSPYRAPASLPPLGDIPTSASSTVSTPLPQHISPTSYTAPQTDLIPPPTASAYDTFMQRAAPGSGMNSVGDEYFNPSALPSTTNSPTSNSTFGNSSTSYLTPGVPSTMPTQQNQHQLHSYDVSMSSGATHSMGMSPSVSMHSGHSHGNVPPSPHHSTAQQGYTVHSHSQLHHDSSMSSSHIHDSRSYVGHGYSYGDLPPITGSVDHAMPYTTPGDSILRGSSTQDVDMKPFAHLTTSGGPTEIHSAPPGPAPWANFHAGYQNGGRPGANGSAAYGAGTSPQEQQHQQQHHAGTPQPGQHQTSYATHWPEYSY